MSAYVARAAIDPSRSKLSEPTVNRPSSIRHRPPDAVEQELAIDGVRNLRPSQCVHSHDVDSPAEPSVSPEMQTRLSYDFASVPVHSGEAAASRTAAELWAGSLWAGSLWAGSAGESGLANTAQGQDLAPPIVHTVLRSSGEPLDVGARMLFESRLARDLRHVRVHTDAEAARSAQAVGAAAYTVGHHVVFGTGRYDVASTQGQRLLGHELAHTVQQQDQNLSHPRRLEIAGADSQLEYEAMDVAEATLSDLGGGPYTGGRARHTLPTSVERITPLRPVSENAIVQRAPQVTADASGPAPTADIQKAHDAFISAKTLAGYKFGDISQQQGSTVQQMKEAAKDQDAPPIAIDVLAAIVGAAISAILPGIGGAIAGLTTEALAQTAVNAAFKKGADLASKAAKDAIKAPLVNTSIAEEYFNGMATTYPALAAAEENAFYASMDALWGQVGTDVDKARNAQKQAEEANMALTQGISSNAFVQQTMDGAFSGLSNVLAQSNAGGVLTIQTTVADKGNIGGKVIESAEVAGISSKLVGLVASRPLSAYKMAVAITASYFTEPTKTGDESASDVPLTHTFTVNVGADGKAQPPSNVDPWLLSRGGGDVSAGAQGLYDDLKDVVIPLVAA